ncbi:hypothetical protein GQ44DRAFT_512296 [Phaeosphaeriaceae sp. PMI808]|nr:hypothetical protein GQ44DRAFT_512296 [Phaeosphaeriaceae sp. PMI808]
MRHIDALFPIPPNPPSSSRHLFMTRLSNSLALSTIADQLTDPIEKALSVLGSSLFAGRGWEHGLACWTWATRSAGTGTGRNRSARSAGAPGAPGAPAPPGTRGTRWARATSASSKSCWARRATSTGHTATRRLGEAPVGAGAPGTSGSPGELVGIGKGAPLVGGGSRGIWAGWG